MIPVELSRIVIQETSEQQYIYITETDGKRSFPIVIGIFEALEINRKVSDKRSMRPMTHDLVRLVIEALGGRLDKVVISDLREGTFYANLYIEQDGKEVLVDCRPSDSIALAAALRVPIFVEEHVMDQVGKDADGGGEDFM